MSLKALLALYHFNIQFVAGDEATYHLNVTEGLEPLLDLYFRNPEWKADLELQGHYLEFCEKEYPDIIDKIRKLCERGQIELISVHYSDQIYIAYPKLDFELSQKVNEEILSKCNLKRSNVFFAQENFFGPMVPEFMKKYGYDIALLARSYYEYFQRVENIAPYYEYDGIYVVLGAEGKYKYGDIEWNWIRYGDGEPVVTGVSPYKLFEYRARGDLIEELERRIKSYERDGYKPMTVGEFVKSLKESGIVPEKLGPILEGAWEMKRCRGVYQWMGYYYNPYEMDVEIRSLTYTSRKYVLAAMTLVKWAEKRDVDLAMERELLNKAIKRQLLAEVSDSTGWRPTFVEVGYSINESHMAIYYSLRIIESIKRKCNLKGKVLIDTWSGDVKPAEETKVKRKEVTLPLNIEWVGGEVEHHCYILSDDEYLIQVKIRPRGKVSGMKIPLAKDYIFYSPSLADDRIERIYLNDYACDKIYLPLPNGLLGIEEKTFIVKNNEKMHLAVTIDKNNKYIGFLVENVPPHRTFDWEFYIIKDEKKALRRAIELNVYPKVIV